MTSNINAHILLWGLCLIRKTPLRSDHLEPRVTVDHNKLHHNTYEPLDTSADQGVIYLYSVLSCNLHNIIIVNGIPLTMMECAYCR